MRFLIGLIAFYASMFVLPRWGWAGAISLAGIALLADYLWRSHQRELREKRRIRDAAQKKKRDAAAIQKFSDAGCFLLGEHGAIWQFEDLYDLTETLVTHDLSHLRPDQRLVIKRADGYFFAFNHARWPSELSEWSVREVIEAFADPSRVGHRTVMHFAKTARAIEFEAARRKEHLDTVQRRVVERTKDFKVRTASDMGERAAAVYVITTRARNCAKIGISDNPDRRRANLQTGSSEPLAVHTSYWLENRKHAALVEQRCHYQLKSSGHFKIGEWFSVEPEVASRFVVDTYTELVEQGVIVEGVPQASEQSTDEELRTEVAARAGWRHSKKGNLIADLFGRKATVFSRRDGWHWVCDGRFSKSALDTQTLAQQAVVAFIDPNRSDMLDYLLAHS